ncbi:MAG: lysine-sensitive aspartokinase 3 [Candidatus Gracilibacteria bacterium]
MNITVAKFGGTSMGNAQAISQVADILEATAGGKVAVVSATSGTTDMLLKLGDLAVSGKSWKKEFEELKAKHAGILNELKVEVDLADFFKEIKGLLEGVGMIKEMSLSANDRLVSFGERISSRILAAILKKRGVGSEAVDAFEIIFTDNDFKHGNVDFEKTDKAVAEKILPMLEKNIVPVVTGFIGQSESGKYITLGRGGSDYTGGIVAAALGASELQIWTDVEGIFNADPRIVKEAGPIEKVSFNEASELAYFGAKVLHPKTIQPAVKKGIPVKVLNTFNPSAKGTLINEEETNSLKSVSSKKGISVINICSSGMLNAHGFMAKIFEVFAKHKVAVDVVATSEVSVSITVDSAVPDGLMEDLKKIGAVTLQEKMAIICLVGNGIKNDSTVLGKMFSAVTGHNISMVSQGASQRNVTFLTREEEATEIVQTLFKTFFKK